MRRCTLPTVHEEPEDEGSPVLVAGSGLKAARALASSPQSNVTEVDLDQPTFDWSVDVAPQKCKLSKKWVPRPERLLIEDSEASR